MISLFKSIHKAACGVGVWNTSNYNGTKSFMERFGIDPMEQ